MSGKMRFLTALCLALTLSACAGHEDADIHIYAGAGLTDAILELCEIWNAADSSRVAPVFASSSTLAQQIVQGAPADLFLSANTLWMDHVENESGRVALRSDLLTGCLALIVPVGNPVRIESTQDLADRRLQRLALGDPSHVPAGIYARAWLEEAGLWDAVAERLLPARDVRAALAYVQRGEADAGIVYASDAKSAGFEPVALMDPPADTPIRFSLALLARADGDEPNEDAGRFHDWLSGPQARVVFLRQGFIPLEPDP